MQGMIEMLAVLCGGAIGAAGRFLLSRFVSELLPKNYPWGIWVVNLSGCFLVGVIAACYLQKEVESLFLRTFLLLGILGGFTTFSSFSLDTMTLLQNGEFVLAITYVLSTVFFSIGATFLGFCLTRGVLC